MRVYPKKITTRLPTHPSRHYPRLKQPHRLFCPNRCRCRTIACFRGATYRSLWQHQIRFPHRRISPTLPPQLKQQAGQRPIIVCGSTRVKTTPMKPNFSYKHGKAIQVMPYWSSYRYERFDAVYQTACRLGFRCQRRSEQQAIAPDTQVWLEATAWANYSRFTKLPILPLWVAA